MNNDSLNGWLLAMSALAGFAATGASQAPTLLKDLNPRQTARYSPIGPGEALSAGTNAYFTARAEGDSSRLPIDLWVTRAGSTTRLFGPKFESVRPSGLTRLGSRVVFVGNTLEYGAEPWISAGTPGSTKPLLDITPGHASSSLFGLRSFGNRVWFLRRDAATLRTEAWTTDGSATGTRRVTQLPGSLPAGGEEEVIVAGAHVYFPLELTPGEFQIWKSDGTQAGTLAASSKIQGSTVRHLTAMGNRIFFTFLSSRSQADIWVSDGSTAGTKKLYADAYGPMAAFKNRIWFTSAQAASGLELASGDGTSAAPVIFDLNPGRASSQPKSLSVIGNKLYFAASDGFVGNEPWVSDGTRAGTKVILDVFPGAGGSQPTSFVQLGNLTLFRTTTSLGIHSLWQTDDSVAGTINMTMGNPNVLSQAAVSHAGAALFYGQRANSRDIEVFITPPQAGQAKPITTKSPPPTPYSDSSFVSTVVDIGDRVLFSAYDAQSSLGSSDGTPSGSRLFGNAYVEPVTGSFARLGRQYFFSGQSPNLRNLELHVTNGTDAGTRRFVDPMTNAGWLYPRSFVPLNGRMLFHASTPLTSGIYSSLGVERLTQRLGSTSGQRSASGIQRLGDAAYYVDAGTLWKTDGITAPVAAAQISGASGMHVSGVVFGSEVCFWTSTTAGSTLWFYDGSSLRSIPVATPNVIQVVVVRDRLFFGDSNANLWISDGTATGTRILRAGVSSSRLTAVGSRLFFSGGTLTEGRELWVSDGTKLGTRMVADLRKGPSSSGALPILSLGDRVIFTTKDRAIWVSDGTTGGTNQLRSTSGRTLEITEFYDGVAPFGAALHKGRVLMGARASHLGYELWSWFPGASAKKVGRACASPTTRNPQLACSPPRLGKTWRLEAHDYLPSKPVVAFFGAPSRPLDVLNCELHIDPASLAVLFPLGNPKSKWTWSAMIPNTAALAGITINVQSIQVSDAALGFDLSNAVQATLGN